MGKSYPLINFELELYKFELSLKKMLKRYLLTRTQVFRIKKVKVYFNVTNVCN